MPRGDAVRARVAKVLDPVSCADGRIGHRAGPDKQQRRLEQMLQPRDHDRAAHPLAVAAMDPFFPPYCEKKLNLDNF